MISDLEKQMLMIHAGYLQVQIAVQASLFALRVESIFKRKGMERADSEKYCVSETFPKGDVRIARYFATSSLFKVD